MKILLFTPTYRRDDGKPAIRPETLGALEAIQDGEHRVTRWVSVDPFEDKKVNVCKQYQEAQKRALAEGYDALMIVEHDVVPPPDALIRLAETDAPVVYGCYMFRCEHSVMNISMANPEKTWLMRNARALKEAVAKGVVECSGLGFGCILIHWTALRDFPFHAGPGAEYFPDTPFARECFDAGVKQVANLNVRCGHVLNDGRVLWPLHPDGSPGTDVLVQVLASCNVVVREELWAIYPGERRYMPAVVARQYADTGYVEIIQSEKKE